RAVPIPPLQPVIKTHFCLLGMARHPSYCRINCNYSADFEYRCSHAGANEANSLMASNLIDELADAGPLRSVIIIKNNVAPRFDACEVVFEVLLNAFVAVVTIDDQKIILHLMRRTNRQLIGAQLLDQGVVFAWNASCSQVSTERQLANRFV